MGIDDELISYITDSLKECLVIVDRTGKIIFMSKSYKTLLGCDSCEGMDILKIIPNSRLLNVAQRGKREIEEVREIKGHKVIVTNVPLIVHGEIKGAVSKIIFMQSQNLDEINRKLKLLQQTKDSRIKDASHGDKAVHTFDKIIGSSEKFIEVVNFAKKIAKGESSVLITGDSGTGKELMAEAIHNESRRSEKPFVKINCGAIPPELFESEMFGYDEGAFTGAKKSGMKGKFEVADGGTILLDEIGDMPLFMQVKLLRVIQEREIVRVGSNDVKKIDVRIIAATNKDLLKLIEEGKFREDLYYRLNVLHIKIPPLRERQEDIPILADGLRRKICSKYNMHSEGISSEALRYLEAYKWPGNVRELENVIERAINLLNDQDLIMPEHLPEKVLHCDKNNVYYQKKLKEVVFDAERQTIVETLKYVHGNKNEASKLLGISRQGLYKKLRILGLEDTV